MRGANPVEVFRYDGGSGDPLVALSPLGVDQVMATFERGNGEHYVVFALLDVKLRCVFDESGAGMLELTDIDCDGQIELLLADTGYIIDYVTKETIVTPNETQIFKWNGNSSRLLRTVRWKDRFQDACVKNHH
jgi:hypothetical protein